MSTRRVMGAAPLGPLRKHSGADNTDLEDTASECDAVGRSASALAQGRGRNAKHSVTCSVFVGQDTG